MVWFLFSYQGHVVSKFLCFKLCLICHIRRCILSWVTSNFHSACYIVVSLRNLKQSHPCWSWRGHWSHLWMPLLPLMPLKILPLWTTWYDFIHGGFPRECGGNLLIFVSSRTFEVENCGSFSLCIICKYVFNPMVEMLLNLFQECQIL